MLNSEHSAKFLSRTQEMMTNQRLHVKTLQEDIRNQENRALEVVVNTV